MKETLSTSPAVTTPAEARVEDRPLPSIFVVALALLLFVGGVYLDKHGGEFSPKVYMPYESVAQLESLAPYDPVKALRTKGRNLYANCSGCHQANGLGSEGQGWPPLVGSDWVLADGPERLVRIVSKGLQGEITVNGKKFGSALMPPVGDGFPGDEKAKSEQIAALLTYIRSEWGNAASPVTPEQVEAIRKKIIDHPQAYTAAELLKIPVKAEAPATEAKK